MIKRLDAFTPWWGFYKSDPNEGILQLVQIVESKNNLFANNEVEYRKASPPNTKTIMKKYFLVLYLSLFLGGFLQGYMKNRHIDCAAGCRTG